MLRKFRIVLAMLMLAALTLLFAGIGLQWWGWAAKLQFLPACLALNLGVVTVILLVTLLFGRIYCSVICPAGIFQDGIIWLRRRIRPRKFSYTPGLKWLRYIVLAVYVASIAAGIQVVVALLAPYSSYGRMVRGFIGIADGSSGTASIIAAAAVLVVLSSCAWFGGRIWCNSICPVGTLLGLVGRFSLFRPRIDGGKCLHCGKCVKGCKCSCIDGEALDVDMSRCVDCFDCIDNCSSGAIRYGLGRKTPAAESAPDKGRRGFLAAGAAMTVGATVAKAEERVAEVIGKQTPVRSERLVPFGAGSVKNFYDHCTACQLCVSACPNGVLRPSTDLAHLLQPEMGYENGFCRPECTACSDVCPSGAIRPLSGREEKAGIRIGTARINPELCLVNLQGVKCGNCAAHCPSAAIIMTRLPGAVNPTPSVIGTRCIGCGECEFLCPSRPISAITVDGLKEHLTRE